MSDFVSGLFGCVFILAYIAVWLLVFGAIATLAIGFFNWVF